MKKIQPFILLLPFIFAAFACHKDNGNANATAILGSWRYTGSLIDTLTDNHNLMIYDSSAGPDLGDTLRFIAPDTVYYTYQGSTIWSNYKVSGNNLILIGSQTNDTLTIHSLSGSKLQIGTSNYLTANWLTFEKFTP